VARLGLVFRMSIFIRVANERREGIDQIRDNLADPDNIRNTVTPVLQQAARIGAQTARIHAPKGRTGRLSGEIADNSIVYRVRGDRLYAKFGVQSVGNPGRGSKAYPIFVHEGTGLYGRLHRLITPKRAKAMTFPGGGKPWPIRFGRTGAIQKITIKGQKPQPYMTIAFEEANEYVNQQLDTMIDRLVD
jgi:hypothetical protein